MKATTASRIRSLSKLLGGFVAGYSSSPKAQALGIFIAGLGFIFSEKTHRAPKPPKPPKS
jgi:hypothetical protein